MAPALDANDISCNSNPLHTRSFHLLKRSQIMADTEETLGQRIRRARKTLQKTQQEIAIALGIMQSQLYQWEKEKQPVPKKHFEAISLTLNIPLEEIKKCAANWIPPAKREMFELKNNYFLVDVLPLMKTICSHFEKDSGQAITIEDLKFLLETQTLLPSPISPALIDELLKNRHSAK